MVPASHDSACPGEVESVPSPVIQPQAVQLPQNFVAETVESNDVDGKERSAGGQATVGPERGCQVEVLDLEEVSVDEDELEWCSAVDDLEGCFDRLQDVAGHREDGDAEDHRVAWHDIADSDEDTVAEDAAAEERRTWTAGRLRRLWGLKAALQSRVLIEAERDGGQELLARLLQHCVFGDEEEVTALELFVDGSARFTGSWPIRPVEAG